MKKQRVLVAALGLAAAMPLTATADSALMKVASVTNADLVDGTSIFRTEGTNGYGLMDMNGSALTGTVYGRSFYYEYGMITANSNEEGINTGGLLDQKGKEIIPFQYGELDMLSSKWAVAIVLEEASSDAYDYESWSDNDTYYKIAKADIYYLGGGTGKCVASLERSQFMEAQAYGDYINILDRSTTTINQYDSSFNQVAAGLDSIYTEPENYKDVVKFSENGQQGLMDKDGNVIMAPAFKYIHEEEGRYWTVSTGEKEGLIDIEGNVIVDAQYEDIKYGYNAPAEAMVGYQRSYVSGGYVAVVQDGKVGFVDANGNMTCQPKYSKDIVEINGASLTLTDLEGNTIIVAADGVETVISGYEVRDLSYGSGLYYSIVDADYNYGMIDWHGEEIFPCENEDISLTGDGKYVYVETDYYAGDIYQLPEITAAPAAAGTEEAAETEAAEAEAAPAETEAAPAAAASSNMAAVTTLLDSAITFVTAEDYTSAVSMLNSVKALIGSENQNVTTLLDSAIALLDAGAADASSINTLLTTAKTLLS